MAPDTISAHDVSVKILRRFRAEHSCPHHKIVKKRRAVCRHAFGFSGPPCFCNLNADCRGCRGLGLVIASPILCFVYALLLSVDSVCDLCSLFEKRKRLKSLRVFVPSACTCVAQIWNVTGATSLYILVPDSSGRREFVL